MIPDRGKILQIMWFRPKRKKPWQSIKWVAPFPDEQWLGLDLGTIQGIPTYKCAITLQQEQLLKLDVLETTEP